MNNNVIKTSAVDMECILNREYVPMEGGPVFLAIVIRPNAHLDYANMPLHVCLCIDNSFSMCGDKLENAKMSAINIINALSRNDLVSIVVFNDEIDTLASGEFVTSSVWTTLQSKISNISCTGLTDLYGGVNEAYTQIKKSAVSDDKTYIKRIILLSDGQPTTQPNTPEEFKSFGKEMREKYDVSVTTVGIGGDYNEDLLMALAEGSGGQWIHAKSPEDIRNIFQNELKRMSKVMDANPKLIINMSKGMEIGKIYKARPQLHKVDDSEIVDNKLIIHLNDVEEGIKQEISARLHLPKRPAGKYRIAKVEYVGKKSNLSKEVFIEYTSDKRLYSEENNAYPRGLFMTVLASDTFIGGDIDKATKIATSLKNDKNTRIFPELNKHMTGILEKSTIIGTSTDRETIIRAKEGATIIDKKRE